MLIYDFPLSKQARMYLKFEQIFKSAAQNMSVATVQETHCLLGSIVDYIDLVDGSGSIKLDIQKDLTRCDASLQKWEQDPDADHDFVKELRGQVAKSMQVLDGFTRQRKVLQDDPIIETVKPKFRTPCGLNCFDTPLFEFWLNLPIEERQLSVQKWLHEFDCLRVPITTILYLWRLCADMQKRTAKLGFLQENADSCDLITIHYSADLRGYPVVSGFQSRINIRFMPYEKGAPVGDIDFEIAYIHGDLQ